MRALLAIAMIALPAMASATVYPCPQAGEGEQLYRGDQRLQAERIDLYSGHPAEMAQLKPDNGDDDVYSPAFWSIAPDKHGYWMVCAYNGGLRYMRELRNDAHRCDEILAGKSPVALECK